MAQQSGPCFKISTDSSDAGDDDGGRSGDHCADMTSRNNTSVDWNKDSSEHTGADSTHRDNN